MLQVVVFVFQCNHTGGTQTICKTGGNIIPFCVCQFYIVALTGGNISHLAFKSAVTTLTIFFFVPAHSKILKRRDLNRPASMVFTG
jgi:hypothetical protein